jgi:hypothetical protein
VPPSNKCPAKGELTGCTWEISLAEVEVAAFPIREHNTYTVPYVSVSEIGYRSRFSLGLRG